jgi:hypothetical protein
MLGAINEAIGALSQRLQRLETLPFNPYSPDCQMFDHFAGDGTIDVRWTTTLAGSGTISLPVATPTVARLSSGATISSTCLLNWGGRFALVGTSAAVDCRARFAVTTAVDADDSMQLRLQTAASDFMRIGVRGATSTAFFFAESSFGGSNSTTTTVPIDTDMHDFRIQTMPDRARYYIDNNLVAEHTANIPTAAVEPRFDLGNGANGGTRTMDIDLFWIRENVS